MERNFDLAGKRKIKEKIIEKLNTFEKDFREKMEANRKQFASAIKKFAEENNTDNIGQLSEFSKVPIEAYSNKIIEEVRKRELSGKPVTKEVP